MERKTLHMKEYRLAETEARFAELIWQREPISSPELVRLCVQVEEVYHIHGPEEAV